MQNIKNLQDAEPLLAARSRTSRAKLVLEDQIREEMTKAKILTPMQMASLEVCPTFRTQDYIVFLVNDTSGNEPVGILWGYAEKLRDNSGFLFSFGTGNSKSGMKLKSCALLSFQGDMQQSTYKFGGEMNDKGDEISFKGVLSDEQFASQITDIVQVESGGLKRIVIASTEDDMHSLSSEVANDTSDGKTNITSVQDEGSSVTDEVTSIYLIDDDVNSDDGGGA